MSDAVKSWGYAAEEADTGIAALKKMRHCYFDLILLDIFLPDTKGHLLIPEIRKLWPHSNIISMMSITSVPQTPGFVKGVINLRGKVIPVMDLRLKFNMDESAYTERTCIIVVEVTNQRGRVQIGIVVDAVSEVLNIKERDIEETPTFGTNLDTHFPGKGQDRRNGQNPS